MNKTTFAAAAALIVGVAVGYVLPHANEEAESLKARLEKSEEDLAAAKKDLASAQARVKKPFDASKVGRPGLHMEKPKAAAAPTNAVAEKVEADAPQPPPPGEPPSPEKVREQFNMMASFMRARTETVRKKVIEDLGLDENSTAVFDNALADMNARLKDSVQTAVDLLADEDNITPELTLRLIGDLTATMAESYDAVGACIPEERRGEVSQLHLVEFVQPEVVEPFLSVQDKLRFGPGMGGPGMGGPGR